MRAHAHTQHMHIQTNPGILWKSPLESLGAYVCRVRGLKLYKVCFLTIVELN